jgi:hypothetical protein
LDELTREYTEVPVRLKVFFSKLRLKKEELFLFLKLHKRSLVKYFLSTGCWRIRKYTWKSEHSDSDTYLKRPGQLLFIAVRP